MIKKSEKEKKRLLKQVFVIAVALIFMFTVVIALKKVFTASFALDNYMGTAEWYKDYTYTQDDANKTITLTKYNGESSVVTVPSSAEIDGNIYQTIIKGGVYQNNTTITSVIFNDGVKAGNTLDHLFDSCSNLNSVTFNDFDSSATTNMSYMFNSCGKIENLDLRSLDTQNVTNMVCMFARCSKLISVDLSNFDTTNVRYLSSMFNKCYAIETLDLSSFYTPHLLTMTSLFGDCNNLKTLDISNFDTRNVTNFSTVYPGSSITKIKLGENYDFKTNNLYIYTGGSFGRGKWLKEEDGQEYNAIDLSIKSSTENIAGTYTKISNYIDEMKIDFPVTHKINKITKIDGFETTNNNIININNNEVFITNLTVASSDDYQVPGKVTLLFNNAVSDVNNNLYNLKMTIDNIHLYNINTDAGVENFVFDMFRIGVNINFYSFFYEDITKTQSVYTNSSSSYDITLEVLDNNQNSVDGSFIFSAYDLDIGSTKDINSSTPEGFKEYGNYSEGINFIEGFDKTTLKLANNTFLQRIGENRITGTRNDTASELSEFIIKADTKKTKFTWTGESCGTIILSQYQPEIITIEKKDTSGNNVVNAQLKLYYENELIDTWTTTSSSKNIFLNPGNYTLTENIVPAGYNKADDIRFTVGTDLRINNNPVDKITMVDTPKKYSYTIYHVEKDNTNNILKTETAEADYKESISVTEQSISGYSYDSKSKDTIVIDTTNNIAYVYYTKGKYNYIVNYYDKETNELLDSKTEQATYQEVINARDEIKTIAKYTYDSSDRESITISENQTSNVLNLYYIKKRGKVIVKYVDKTKNTEISERTETTGKVDENYETTSKEIEGYKLVGNTENTTGVYRENDIEVIYYYQKEVPVTVNYIDKLTNEKIEVKTDKGYIGDQYTGVAKDIEGYVLVEKPEEETIELKETENILNYYYIKESEGIIEKHVDINNNEILYNEEHKGKVGDEYNILSREFEGYKLVEEKLPTNAKGKMTKEPIEVIYYYKKQAKVIIRYKDQHTKEEIIPKEEKKGYEGDPYTIEEKEIKDYKLVKVEGERSGQYQGEEIEVIYYYEKIKGYSPQTSDDRNIIVWIIIGIISILGIGALITFIKKH